MKDSIVSKSARGRVAINDEVRNVLSGHVAIRGQELRITRPLARDIYTQVRDVLVALGGPWVRGKEAHVFAPGVDVPALLADALGKGHAVNEAKALNFFPTPPELARRMVEVADIRRQCHVLEPSAGTGNLIIPIEDPVKRLVTVEVNEDHAGTLVPLVIERSLGYRGGDVRTSDFLTETPGLLGTFNRILMNPPFERGADIRHINHALTFLQDGGRLVAICGGGPRQREALHHKALLWEELPAGTFKSAGTDVNTVLLIIEK